MGESGRSWVGHDDEVLGLLAWIAERGEGGHIDLTALRRLEVQVALQLAEAGQAGQIDR